MSEVCEPVHLPDRPGVDGHYRARGLPPVPCPHDSVCHRNLPGV